MEGQLHKQIKDVKMKTSMIFLTFITNVLIGTCTNHQSNTLIENFVDEIVVS